VLSNVEPNQKKRKVNVASFIGRTVVGEVARVRSGSNGIAADVFFGVPNKSFSQLISIDGT
jgi:hypothetical protein